MTKATKLSSSKVRKYSKADMGNISVILGVHVTKASLKVQLEAKGHTVTGCRETMKTNSASQDTYAMEESGTQKILYGQDSHQSFLSSLDKESVC